MADLNNTWNSFFNKDNIYSYAKASIELYEVLKILDGQAESIVVPSRGAVPFLKHANSLNYFLLDNFDNFKDRVNFKIVSLSDILNNDTMLPFSADPFDTLNSQSIRGFWVKILKDLIDGQKTSVYIKFYRFLVEKVAKEGWYHSLNYRLPTDNFIFIDTVISGRAICEIIKEFEKNQLDRFYLVLIVDKNGENIKSEYKKIIDHYVSLGRCFLINVNNLFTEDQGPSISGIWSTVYPQIMSELKRRYKWAQEIYGAGTYYIKISNSLGLSNYKTEQADYNLPMTTLYGQLSIHISMVIQNHIRNEGLKLRRGISKNENLTDEEIEIAIRRNNEKLDHMLNYAFSHNKNLISQFVENGLSPLDKELTASLSRPRIKEKHPNFTVDVSSSHLVRVSFPEEKIKELFRVFEAEYLPLTNIFHDCHFERINERLK